jgi:photosystem II stability/assembly factor-like uncharacterized protein
MNLRRSINWCVISIFVCLLALKLFPSDSLAQPSPDDGPKLSRCSDVTSIISAGPVSAWKVTVSSIDTQEPLNSVYFLDALNGWVASERKLYQTRSGGNNWKQVKFKFPEDFRIRSITFFNRSLGWAVLEKSDYDFKKEQLRVMHTSDGGVTWQTQLKRQSAFGGALSIVDERNGWLVANSYHESLFYAPLVLHTSDQGKTWTDVSVGLLKSFPANIKGYRSKLTNIVAKSGTTATISALNGRIFTTSNGGRDWQEVEFSCAGNGLSSPGQVLGVKGNSRLWMADGADSLEGFWGEAYEQQNNGSWVRYVLSNFALASASYISESEVLAAGSSINEHRGHREAAILYSSDRGRTWQIIYRNEQIERIRALAAIDTNRFWALGENGLILRFKFSSESTYHREIHFGVR